MPTHRLRGWAVVLAFAYVLIYVSAAGFGGNRFSASGRFFAIEPLVWAPDLALYWLYVLSVGFLAVTYGYRRYRRRRLQARRRNPR